MTPTVVIAANDGWNIVNYRAGLIVAFQEAGLKVAVLAPDGPHSAAIRRLGADFHSVAMNPRGKSPLADLGVTVRYIRALRAIRPAAFLGFTAKPNIYGSLAAQLCGVPVINNISGLGAVFAKRNWLTGLVSMLYRLALGRSATVFFQNRDDLALFEGTGLARSSQAALVPGSGVDVDRFAPREAKEAGEPFVFLLVARLLWDKGIGEFVEAARRLKARSGTAVRFQILGIIEPRSSAAVSEAQLHAWVDEGIIDFLGAAQDVRPALAGADCVVLPSYYREGVPRVLLEASSMALPVITTDSPGCREAVDDETTGFLCEPRSADSLRSAMERMVALPADDRRKMGAAGRVKMEREYREEIVHRAYLDALGKLGVRGS
jgi:glycosyltransferase involved in cell wall biosynthesis